MPITQIDAKANHVEQLYHDLEGEAPRRARAVLEDFSDVLRLERDFEVDSGDLFVSRTAKDFERLCECEDAIREEINGLALARCEQCGQSKRFVRRQTVEEVVEVDAGGEFVEAIYADVRDVWRIECYECESNEIRGGSELG